MSTYMESIGFNIHGSIAKAFVVTPRVDEYDIGKGVTVTGLAGLLGRLAG